MAFFFLGVIREILLARIFAQSQISNFMKSSNFRENYRYNTNHSKKSAGAVPRSPITTGFHEITPIPRKCDL